MPSRYSKISFRDFRGRSGVAGPSEILYYDKDEPKNFNSAETITIDNFSGTLSLGRFLETDDTSLANYDLPNHSALIRNNFLFSIFYANNSSQYVYLLAKNKTSGNYELLNKAGTSTSSWSVLNTFSTTAPDMAIVFREKILVIFSNGSVQYSEDNGNSFSTISGLSLQNVRAHYIGSDGYLYISNDDGIYRSKDGRHFELYYACVEAYNGFENIYDIIELDGFLYGLIGYGDIPQYYDFVRFNRNSSYKIIRRLDDVYTHPWGAISMAKMDDRYIVVSYGYHSSTYFFLYDKSRLRFFSATKTYDNLVRLFTVGDSVVVCTGDLVSGAIEYDKLWLLNKNGGLVKLKSLDSGYDIVSVIPFEYELYIVSRKASTTSLRAHYSSGASNSGNPWTGYIDTPYIAEIGQHIPAYLILNHTPSTDVTIKIYYGTTPYTDDVTLLKTLTGSELNVARNVISLKDIAQKLSAVLFRVEISCFEAELMTDITFDYLYTPCGLEHAT